MKNVLVTGGAGFIGSHLTDLLLGEKSWRVVVVDDFNDFYAPAIKRANVEPHLNNPNFELVKADIRDCAALRNIFRRHEFDQIVHLAARAGVRPSLDHPHLYVETNVCGTLNLLELAHEFQIRKFVFGSSSSVYGDNAKSPFSEEQAVNRPISQYAATKAAGELMCHTYSHLYPMACVCLRFFTVYGARQRPDLAIHKFARLILDETPLPVFGDGRTRRDYTFVADIVGGVRAAMDYCETRFEIINLGNSQPIELQELVFLLEKVLRKKAIIEKLPAQIGDMPETCADINKAKRLLNYAPTTRIEEGLAIFAEWLRRAEVNCAI